jgi:hypothetical protein
MVEAVLIILVFLFFVLGMIDLGVGVLRQNIISQAARHGARKAMVHGELAKGPPGSGWAPWGPATIGDPDGVPASTTGIPLVDQVRPMLVGCDLDQTRVKAEWLDGSNALEKRVRVSITSPYRPMVTFLLGSPTFTLRAASTMPIAH